MERQKFYGGGKGPPFVAPLVGPPVHDLVGHYVDVLDLEIDNQALDDVVGTLTNKDPYADIVLIDISSVGEDDL